MTAPMRLRHAEVLRAVMLSGTVSGAAQLLHVSQPAATRALQQAEDALGFRLFDRVKGRLHPTPEAVALHAEGERVFAGLDHLRRLARSLRAGGEGRLRVAAAPALSLAILPRAIAAFRRAHPEVVLEVETLHASEVAQGVLLRELDLGFAFDPPPHPGLTRTEVARGDLVAIFPPDHAQRGPCALSDLTALPFIGLRGADPLGVAFDSACRAAEVTLSPAVEVQTYHVALSLVAQGVGAAVVDGFTAAASRAHEGGGRVVARPLSPAIPFPVACVRAGHRAPSAAATRFEAAFRAAVPG